MSASAQAIWENTRNSPIRISNRQQLHESRTALYWHSHFDLLAKPFSTGTAILSNMVWSLAQNALIYVHRINGLVGRGLISWASVVELTPAQKFSDNSSPSSRMQATFPASKDSHSTSWDSTLEFVDTHSRPAAKHQADCIKTCHWLVLPPDLYKCSMLSPVMSNDNKSICEAVPNWMSLSHVAKLHRRSWILFQGLVAESVVNSRVCCNSFRILVLQRWKTAMIVWVCTHK